MLSTSFTLSQGIQVLGGADLIICGKQTTDGDTAQVGPAIAEHLHIPHAAWVTRIEAVDEKSISVEQKLGNVTQVSPDPVSVPDHGGKRSARLEEGNCQPEGARSGI